MINDGTALVLYRIAVGVATGSAFSFGGAVLEFIGVSAGGIAVGLAVGAFSDLVVRRQTDGGLSIFLSVLTAYGAYVGAEQLHVSGVLAAVVAGVYGGYQSPRSLDADIRLSAVAFWGVLVFGLEITLFVLLGLQLPGRRRHPQPDLGRGQRPAVAGGGDRRRLDLRPPRLRLRDGHRCRRDGRAALRRRLERDARRRLPRRRSGGAAQRRRPAADHLPQLRPDPRHPGRPGPLAAVHRPRAEAGRAAALERRGGGGADGGGAVGARPPRPDRGRGAGVGLAAEAPARPLPRPLPDVPGGARRRGPRRPRRASSASPTTASCAAS